MKQIFINLPILDIEKSMYFYSQLGFLNKPSFSDEHQKCMIWSDYIYVMLLSQKKFELYSKRNISDKTNCNAYFTLPVKSLNLVNEIIENGLKAGGKEPNPMIDEGFMQVRRIEDLDGHIWDITYLDESKFKNK